MLLKAQMLDSTIHYCAKVESVTYLFTIWVQTSCLKINYMYMYYGNLVSG